MLDKYYMNNIHSILNYTNLNRIKCGNKDNSQKDNF